MSEIYKYNKIGKGVVFNEIYDEKFKTNLVTIRFITPLNKKMSPRYSLLSFVLSTSNMNIPSREMLKEQLLTLYDSSIWCSSYSFGDYQATVFNLRYIGDEYTINSEIISTKAVKIFLDCIFEPHIENRKFYPEYFEQSKRELVDSIKSEINDRRGYAITRAKQTIFCNEPASIHVDGTVEYVESITQADLIEAYQKLLSESYIDVTVGGGKPNLQINDMIFKALEKLDRNVDIEYNFSVPTEIKSEPAEITEKYDVSQCKMIMAYKTDSADFYAQKVMSALMGGTAFSLLFTNVREKLSLCYYCASNILECKRVMLIDSGVEKSNIDKARTEIEKQLQSISDGEFSDELFENTKSALCNGFKSNCDSIESLNSWYFTQRIRGGEASPDEINEIIRSVSKERVIASAKSFKLDTVYVMEPEVE